MRGIIDIILNTKNTKAEEEQRTKDFEHAGAIARVHGKASALNYLSNQGYIYISDSDRFDYRVGLNLEQKGE